MKHLLILFLMPFILHGQNIIDPVPVINSSTPNFDVINREQNKFLIGWNWGCSALIAEKLYTNKYTYS